MVKEEEISCESGRSLQMVAHFFTGFPGFIASQLIREVFRKNHTDQVYVLVLQTELQKAQREAMRIMETFPGRHIELIEGDITLPNLGIDQQSINRILPQISMLWHLAAIYDLAVPREIAWKVNVLGTSMVNDFVKTLPNLSRYLYFSTAYVAGNRKGRILETELIRPEKFKNYYEETKFEAEILVEKLKTEIPITIIRPGIVRGHTLTGETIKFDGPYFFLNMIERLKNLPFIPYIGDKVTTINVVPVDFIIQSSLFISSEPSAIGKTLHLTDPFPHPVQEVFRMMVLEMTGKLPKGKFPLSFVKWLLQNKLIRQKLGVEKEALDYLTWNAQFDCREAQLILKKGNIRCSDFMSSIPAMVRFYRVNKNNKHLQVEIK